MADYSRRGFLRKGTVGALVGGTSWPALSHAAEQPAAGGSGAPDLAVLNASIYTVDAQRPRAEAFAVKNGRFLAVGSTAEIRKLITRGTQVIDADKQVVVPGFIDAHCHPASSGLDELLDVNCDLRTIAEIKKAIQARAA